MPAGKLRMIRKANKPPRKVPRMYRYKTVHRRGKPRRTINPRSTTLLTSFNAKSPFPQKFYTKTVYEDVYTLSVGTSGVLGSIQRMILNGLYDVDETGGGHQPYGFDQITAIYDRYKVKSAMVEITAFDPEGIDTVSVCTMVTNPAHVSDSIAGLSPSVVAERQMGGLFMVTDTGFGTKVYKKMYIPMNQAFGVSKLQYDADITNTTGSDAGNPGSLAKIQFACADPKGGSSGSVKIRIRITNYVQFYQRQVLAQS